MSRNRSSVLMYIVLCLLLIAIGVLGYMLWSRNHRTRDIHAHGAATPIVRNTGGVFSDGLTSADGANRFAPDETGAGITGVETFYYDINGDGTGDRITRTHHAVGTAHDWDEYTVELAFNGNWRNITPDGFRTTVGAECALQKLQFVFAPHFHIVHISRPWVDTWDTPSPAIKTIYEIRNNKLVPTQSVPMGTVCDVSELFIKE